MDLMQRTLYENCKLALPSGLTELMSDISREQFFEVLRAQPENIYQFITDYLAAILVTRDNMFIASNICSEVCKGSWHEELDDELRKIGLVNEDINKAMEVIFDYFKSETVNETKLMMELIRETDIEEENLPAVQEAIRIAFKRQHLNIQDFMEASYRAYGIQRETTNESNKLYKPVNETKCVVLAIDKDNQELSLGTIRPCLRTVSSTTLAGSYMNLPKYRPYSPHDSIPVLESEENSDTLHDIISDAKSGNEEKHSKDAIIQHKCDTSGPDIQLEYDKEQEKIVPEDDIEEEIDPRHDDDTSEESIDEVIYDKEFLGKNTAEDNVNYQSENDEIDDQINYISNSEDY